ncbi:MAG: hypothetical protein FJY67_11260, partial [Calditrichaeota bacterium]|nr:hypothetical protein [Calditrichota bacterium]
MSEYLGPLLTDKSEIAKTLVSRKKSHIEKSVSISQRLPKAETLDRLMQKAALEEPDGWTILRKPKKYTKTLRLKKSKPIDEQLEDRIWVTLAYMGFSEMSIDRNFRISVGEGLNSRQIDVYAKDNES